MAQIGFIVHQIALLEPKIGRVGAGLAVSVMTFMAIAGRLRYSAWSSTGSIRGSSTAASLVSQAAALLTIWQTDDIAPGSGRLCGVSAFQSATSSPCRR